MDLSPRESLTQKTNLLDRKAPTLKYHTWMAYVSDVRLITYSQHLTNIYIHKITHYDIHDNTTKCHHR